MTAPNQITTDRLLKIRDVIALTSLSRPTIYRLSRSGSFPSPVQLSPGRVGFSEAALREWLNSRTSRKAG